MIAVSDEMILEVSELLETDGMNVESASKEVAEKHGLGNEEAIAIALEYYEIHGMLESSLVALDAFVEKREGERG